MLDFGDGATGLLTTCTHDFVGTDRLEILCDGGKVIVDGSQQVTVSRLAKPEQEISDAMDPDAVRRLFTGQLDQAEYISTETKTYDSVWGAQHAEVLRNFAAAVRGEEELLAPGSEGIHGVRLANAIHLSSWLGQEVSITDFDEDRYLAELNTRIEAEGKFPPAPERHDHDHDHVQEETTMAVLGVQLMMLRDRIEADGMFAVLEQVKELDLDAVEVSQVAMTDELIADLERGPKELGIEVGAMSAALRAPGNGFILADEFDNAPSRPAGEPAAASCGSA